MNYLIKFLKIFNSIDEYKKIEKTINYKFKKKSLLRKALTHKSDNKNNGQNYERLEFLGDSIIDYLVCDFIYKRFPDLNGFQYWIKMGNNELNTYKQIGESFFNSKEFTQRYGENISNELFLTNLYENIFERLPDEDGYNYWLGRLKHGLENQAEVLMGFSESLESQQIFTAQTMI